MTIVPEHEVLDQQHAAARSASPRPALLALALLVPVPSLGVLAAMVFDLTRGTGLGQTIYFVSKLWILALPLAWLLVVERGRIGLSPSRKEGLLVGAVLGAAIASLIIMVYWVAARDWIDAAQMREAAVRNGIGTPARYLMLAITLALVNSLLEEYVWRWFVFRQCEALMGSLPAIMVSALMFTAHHVIALRAQTNWNVTLLACAGVFIGGCAWSWCYQRYRSIWPGYVSHVIADCGVFLVGWMVLFGS